MENQQNITQQQKDTTQQETNTNWLDEEVANMPNKGDFVKKDPFKMEEEGKIYEIEIDFTTKFDTYSTTDDKGNHLSKAIIPCRFGGKDLVFWLNKKNPLYKQIIEAGKAGQKSFKIIRMGKQNNTKYTLLK